MVNPEHSLYIAFLFLGSVTITGSGIYVLFKERSNFSRLYMLLTIASTIYTFGYGMELTSRTIQMVEFWGRFQYIGIPFIPTLHFLLIVYYSTSEKKVNRLFVFSLLFCSVLILAARQTNSMHHLFYRETGLGSENGVSLFFFTGGPFYKLAGSFFIFSMFASMLVISFFSLRIQGAFRKQAYFIIAGTLLYIPLEAVLLAGWVHTSYDLIPIVVVVNGILFSLAIIRYRLITLVPVARDYILEVMSDAVIVVDHNSIVADANPLAIRAFSEVSSNPVGLSLDSAFPLFSTTDKSGEKVIRGGRVWETSISRITRKAGAYIGTVIVVRDVTDRENMVSRLEKIARIDALTGLLNRGSWQQAVEVEMERLARHGRYGTLLYLDLDYFKKINDNFGHSVGDQVLARTAEILVNGVRRPDLIGRLGGEEFGLFLPESTPESGARVAERLRIELMQGFTGKNDAGFKVSGSFGVAGFVISPDSLLDDLISQADKAMYRSKKAGRNRVSVADPVRKET